MPCVPPLPSAPRPPFPSLGFHENNTGALVFITALLLQVKPFQCVFIPVATRALHCPDERPAES